MYGSRSSLSACRIAFLVALVALSLGSCTMADNQMDFDRASEKSFQDFRDGLAPQPEPAKQPTAGAPDFQPIVAMPADLKLPSPLVTIAVNESVALSDVLHELTEQADVDLELDPSIRGSIIFSAKERPFGDVVDRICEMAGLRYKFQNNVLRVERDLAYVKTYKVDYMNIGRKSTSSVSNDVSVSGDDEAATTGASSDTKISNESTASLWEDLDASLKHVLASVDNYSSLATTSNPPVFSALPVIDAAAGVDPSSLPPALMSAQPVAEPSASDEETKKIPATYSISKETGVVSIFATERQHKIVSKFLNEFRRTATMQVLIEAKILEVSLTDEFAAGIDWGTTGLVNDNNSVTAGFAAPIFSPVAGSAFRGNFDFGKVEPVIEALSRFGTVRALSSPRVTVMNSQPAVVNVTNNRVYFLIDRTVTPATAVGVPPTITEEITIKRAPEGVMMSVLPKANPDTGEIMLAVRPTITKITDQVEDPVDNDNLIPELSVQEIDSILKIQSGQTLIMGGLMKDQTIAEREGLPVVSEMPVIGALFRNHGDKVQKSELVILLRATVVPSAYVSDVDKALFKDFSNDRHH